MLRFMFALTLLCAVASPAAGQATFTPREENPEDFPPGKGREDTFYFCTACHNFRLVAQQGMDRRRWDETLTWMTERQGMAELKGEERETILDYLEMAFPSSEPAGGRAAPNPFLNR
ncbi:MAG: hypothetical protein M5U33_04395 [Pseudorhodoplanes sp.]|nr:hypothetical protein [Pseudorhodoplanes sp.]MBW7950539.1 hypothetical protein [Pseudorhodoplanes sp.]MCL4709853.1 hypothetical protein [Pseudorhodoplanes sp.]MCZ7642112.1 hypothetical protein [Pseudorhodoplanes sp.]